MNLFKILKVYVNMRVRTFMAPIMSPILTTWYRGLMTALQSSSRLLGLGLGFNEVVGFSKLGPPERTSEDIRTFGLGSCLIQGNGSRSHTTSRSENTGCRPSVSIARMNVSFSYPCRKGCSCTQPSVIGALALTIRDTYVVVSKWIIST